MAKNRLDYQAQLSRHSHDVSAGYSASIAPGLIVPQFFDILGPGDSIYYRTHMFARLQDVVTAFLGEIDLHIDYFFVPLQMIYTPFGQIYAQTDDYLSSVYQNMPSKDSYPLMNILPSSPVDNYILGTYGYGTPYPFECYGKQYCRLMDALDANPLVALDSTAQYASATKTPGTSDIDQTLCTSPYVSPWIFCAYQAIYQKFYRNDEFERLNVGSYNIDQFWNSSNFPATDQLIMRYCQRSSDYFTKTRVSPIASAVNAQYQTSGPFPANGGSPDSLIFKVDSFLTTGGSSFPFTSFIQPYNSSIINTQSSSSFEGVDTIGNSEKASNSSYAPLSASNIRALFAVDKYARIYGRADKTYDDQILAHFGIHIPHDVKHDLTHLKHYHCVIQSDPIFGTANVATNNGSLNSPLISTIGQVGGQGSSTLDSDQEKFTAPVHGVFMAVAYVVTKPRYTHTFSKLHLLKDRLSFPIPEYDKLGAQPLYAFECNRYYLQNSYISTRIGWQNRYQQFKEKYDRASLVYAVHDYGHVSTANNIYSSWIIARNSFAPNGNTFGTTSSMVPPYYFFESPYALNNIMIVPYNGDWNDVWYEQPHLMFQQDPILTEFKCFAKKVSWMSETGEPDL